MKILTIIGARPQFIKAATISREIALNPDIMEIIVHTGQHYDPNMSKLFFEELGMPAANYNLGINSAGHGAMTGRMLEALENVLLKEKPDFVLIYGDTNSTLAGALAAKKLHIKVVHVEAGLRSYNKLMPEEVNRIIVDHISDILFCPTDIAVRNLRKEGFKNVVTLKKNTSYESLSKNQPLVINCGDIMYDAALFSDEISSTKSSIIEKLDLKEGRYVLCTIHRAENTNDPMRLQSIINALLNIGAKIPIVLPLHPRTRIIISESLRQLEDDLLKVVSIIDPVGHFDMVELLKNCKYVMTDSGGLQKEAFFFKKPCLTLRDETEWTELIDAGVNVLVGADFNKITNEFNLFGKRRFNFDIKPYGEGNSRKNILEILSASFNQRMGT